MGNIFWFPLKLHHATIIREVTVDTNLQKIKSFRKSIKIFVEVNFLFSLNNHQLCKNTIKSPIIFCVKSLIDFNIMAHRLHYV